MLAYYCDTFVLPLPEKHRFPMAKYELLRKAIQTDEVLSHKVRLELPPAATDEQITLAHDVAYLNSLKEGKLDPKIERRIGFPYSLGMLERSRRSVGATLAACRAALKEGVGVNLAGGTHHAFSDRGEGFCVFNDTVVALRTLQKGGAVKRAVVIDTDVHQGNGTAHLLENDDSIFTFSIHGEKNFPFRKERSDLDIGLPDGTEDEDYLKALAGALDKMTGVEADFCVFQSGADPYHGDKLGRLSLTFDGLLRRDRMVLEWCRRRALPVAVTMGGGYCPEVEKIVSIHLQTIRCAYHHFQENSLSFS